MVPKNKIKNISKPILGLFLKHNINPQYHLFESLTKRDDIYNIGSIININYFNILY